MKILQELSKEELIRLIERNLPAQWQHPCVCTMCGKSKEDENYIYYGAFLYQCDKCSTGPPLTPREEFEILKAHARLTGRKSRF